MHAHVGIAHYYNVHVHEYVNDDAIHIDQYQIAPKWVKLSPFVHKNHMAKGPFKQKMHTSFDEHCNI